MQTKLNDVSAIKDALRKNAMQSEPIGHITILNEDSLCHANGGILPAIAVGLMIVVKCG
jgi:hypothetical protein